MQRSSRRFGPSDLLSSLLAEAAGGDGSLTSLCAASGAKCSPQNIHKRLGSSACDLLASVLAGVIGRQSAEAACSLFGGRIIVEDCSHFLAPEGLCQALPSHGNQHGATAGVKLHLAFDLLGGRPLRCDLIPARVSDQSLAERCVEDLEAGDLLVRDKGFFAINSLVQIQLAGAFYLSRLPRSVKPMDDEGRLLDLPGLVAGATGSSVELVVRIGQETDLPTRLILLRLPRRVALERIRAWRQKSGKRRGRLPSEELFWCHWEPLVTNLDATRADAETLASLYRCRWRIELIFKALKSGGFARMLAGKATNVHHWLALLLARLIALALVLPLEAQLVARLRPTRPPSVLKFLRWALDRLRMTILQRLDVDPEATGRILTRCLSMDRRKLPGHHDHLRLVLG